MNKIITHMELWAADDFRDMEKAKELLSDMGVVKFKFLETGYNPEINFTLLKVDMPMWKED